MALAGRTIEQLPLHTAIWLPDSSRSRSSKSARLDVRLVSLLSTILVWVWWDGGCAVYCLVFSAECGDVGSMSWRTSKEGLESIVPL